MSLPATAILEVGPSGSDTQCAGGFNAARGGTDYSQQNAAQATGTVTSSTTTVTATTGIFTSAMVGNYITDGTTTKEITAFTSSTVVTVDSAPSWTAATIYVGGRLASPGKASSLIVTGNIVYVLGGSATTYNLSSSGNVAGGYINSHVSCIWIGRGTTRTDTSSGVPVLNAAGTFAINPTFSSESFFVTVVDGFKFTGGGYSCNNPSHLRNVWFSTITSGPACDVTDGNQINTLQNAFFDACGGSFHGALSVGAVDFRMADVVIRNPPNRGMDCTSTHLIADRVLCYGGAEHGLLFRGSGSAYFRHCVARGMSSSGIRFEGIGRGGVANSIVANNGTYGVDMTVAAVNSFYMRNVAGRSNTSGNYNANIPSVQVDNFISLPDEPFNAPASDDFTLSTTASSYALLKALGWPTSVIGTSPVNYLDIGMYQHQDSGGGVSGACLVNASALVTPAGAT